MRQVGIYQTSFPRITDQAFIGEQIRHFVRYDPLFLIRTKLKAVEDQHIAISDRDRFKLKQRLFWLTRSPHLFGKSDQIANLNLIHAHLIGDGIYVMPLADQLNIPLIVTMHEDHTKYRRALQQPFELHLNQFLTYQDQFKARLSAFMAVTRLFFYEEAIKKRASAFISVSRFTAEALIKIGYPQDKVLLHYIGVDTEKFSPASTPATERYILCVGRHVAKKGIDTLLRAFAQIAPKYPAVTLIQVGTGELSPYLHTLVEELGLQSRVRFLGAQPHETVLQLMQGAEVFALPSQTDDCGDVETLGIVFNEASACGIPVVATWHGGIPEAVLDGKTGFLVAEKDGQKLAERLDILLGDRSLSQEMGRQGRDYVCETFNIRKQSLKLEEIYDRAIAAWKG
jgi:glycosyltransferase involved in cell wall biosynthesis